MARYRELYSQQSGKVERIGVEAAPTNAYNQRELKRIVEDLLHWEVEEVEFLPGGRNNRVGRARGSGGVVAVKCYFQDPHDKRSRLHAEYTILDFLWSNGIRCIPQPIAADHKRNIGLYGFVEGVKAKSGSLELADVRALASLLLSMWELRGKKRADELPNASEACFSPSDYVVIIERRLRRLFGEIEGDACGREAIAFLRGDFSTVFSRARSRVESDSEYAATLHRSEQALSPSDHGFHNALKGASGQWVFIDFEYAGWDDPAKMIADACLQPEVPMPDAYRTPFADDLLTAIDSSGRVRHRLKMIYPLVGLKWCMIILNEFVAVAVRRRNFSLNHVADRRLEQLQLARTMLAKVVRDMDDSGIFDS